GRVSLPPRRGRGHGDRRAGCNRRQCTRGGARCPLRSEGARGAAAGRLEQGHGGPPPPRGRGAVARARRRRRHDRPRRVPRRRGARAQDSRRRPLGRVADAPRRARRDRAQLDRGVPRAAEVLVVHLEDVALAPLRERFGDPAPLEWDGEISDPEWALATYNPARTHDVTLFILGADDRLPLIRKPQFADGVWRPPGGGIKPGEDVVDGAVREALEETGLHVELERYLVATDAVFRNGGRELHWRTHVLLART